MTALLLIGELAPAEDTPPPPARPDAKADKKPMKKDEPMAGEMKKPGMMKGDMKKAADEKDREMKPMMEQEEKKEDQKKK